MTTDGEVHRAGFVAIAGRPNVGKSSLLNRIVGQKISIVSDKPQTTRTRILGIKTLPSAQMVFVDAPGIHDAHDLLNKRMVMVAEHALVDADVVLWLLDATRPSEGLEGEAIDLVARKHGAVCVGINKIDAVPKPALLPIMTKAAERLPQREIVPISARTGENVDSLLEVLTKLLPAGERLYDEDELTDQTERTLVQEMIREKVFAETHHEVPYSTAVTIDAFEERSGRDVVVIKATIHLNRDNQKAIVIGKGGARLKAIGQKARTEIEKLLGQRVYLELFVRVQEGWSSDLRRIKEFGL